MDKPKEESTEEVTDGSSIKPVSSLRSQFENMTATRPIPVSGRTSPTPAVRRPSQELKTILSEPKVPSRGRESLEVPQQDALTTSPDTSDSDRRAPPVPKPRRRRRSPGKQDASPNTSVRTPQRSPPRLNIVSPRSPPKHIQIPRDPYPTSPHRASLTPTGLKSDTPITLPQSHQVSKDDTMHTGHQRSLSPRPLDLQSLPPKGSNYVANGDLKKSHTMPPPVNRAAKPKIASGEVDSESTLLRKASVQDEKVSPFNTPPSSDGGSPSPTGPPPIPEQTKPRILSPSTQARPTSIQVFAPPPKRDVRSASQPAQQTKPFESSESDLAEHRPMLPPRRQDMSEDPSRSGAPDQENQIQRSIALQGRSSALSQGFSTTISPQPGRRRSPAPRHVTCPSDSPSSRNPTPPPRHPTEPRWIQQPPQQRQAASSHQRDVTESGPIEVAHPSSAFPDSSQANRSPPWFSDGPRLIPTGSDARLFSVCGEYICTTGALSRVWNLLTGKLLLSMNHGETVKVTALAFKPARKLEDEGKRLWFGTNWGDILEVDIPSKKIIATNNTVHNRREIVRIYRHATELWTLDDEGKLAVWPPDKEGSPNLAHLVLNPKIMRGHSSSIVVRHELWVATGKDIRVFRPTTEPDANVQVLERPLSQSGVGDITTSAVIPSQPDRVYFGHTDGKISVYSTKSYSCLGVHNVNVYRINCLVGVGKYLWAGYNTGMIYVYDTARAPWSVQKDWLAHANPVVSTVVDRSSIWKLDRLQVLTLGMDNMIGIWDGMLKNDWFDEEMQTQEASYCSFRQASALVLTWNAGASKPADLRNDEKDSNFFRELFQAREPPDILVFGLQELVDLEDKALTAKSFFKSKNKDPYGQEQLSSVYRAWRDHLNGCLDDFMPLSENYSMLQTASLVGLFSCIFVKTSLKSSIRDLQVAEIKTGLGGLHGNKGAIIIRLILDDSSLCFVNCHLAAGQTQTANRNNDVASILETAALTAYGSATSNAKTFVGGGDGSMIMDHETCILNGDLNYRIDTMPRDSVVSAIRSNNLKKLLERDQLSLSKKRNPGFRLRAFRESPINFAPTYKYDVGTDTYDSSDKRRSPAWCDRILYRGRNSIEQLEYRRHEVRVSDHRPVSGRFQLRIKTVQAEKWEAAMGRCEDKFEQVKQRVSTEAKLDYLTQVFGLTPQEAQKLLG